MLLAAQLVYNITLTKTIKVTPFFANFKYEADFQQGPEVIVPHTAVKADQIYTLYKILRKELEFITERIKEYYNRH